MYRHQQSPLKERLHRSRRNPLVLRGACQVGKSTLIELFCESEAVRDLVTVNLERHRHLAEVYATNDPATILNHRQHGVPQSWYRKRQNSLHRRDSGRTEGLEAYLRYFFEKMPQPPVVAAGSLMEFILSDHTFSMPVGRIEYVHPGDR